MCDILNYHTKFKLKKILYNNNRKIVLVWLILMLLINMIMPGIFFKVYGDKFLEEKMIFISSINQCFIFFFGVFIYFRSNRDSEQNVNIKDIICSIIIGTITYTTIRLIVDSFKWLYVGLFNGRLTYNGLENFKITNFIFLLLTLGIIPGICEELFYRRAILNYVKNKKKAFVLSIILFAIAHIFAGFESVVRAFILGVILTYLYQKRRKFYEVLLIHIYYNCLELIFAYYIRFPSDCYYITKYVSSDGECIFGGIMILNAAIILFGIVMLLINIYVNGYKKTYCHNK